MDGSRRRIRHEEYAVSGPLPEYEETISSQGAMHIKIRPRRTDEHLSAKKHVASASHHENDAYLDRFEKAHEELNPTSNQTTPSKELRQVSRPQSKRSEPHATPPKESERPFEIQDTASDSWTSGPANPEGSLHSVSNQPLLCMDISADKSEIVVGSSDHALYAIPLTSQKSIRASRPRTLYTKAFGHTEWVTCVTYLPDRRIVSGGMDSKLCLWDATGARCEDLLGHSGSVSFVHHFGNDTVLSGGYDKCIRVWDIGKRTSKRQREKSVVKAGSAPLLAASIVPTSEVVAVGDRDGSIHAIDLKSDRVAWRQKQAHKGHATSILSRKENVIASGGQDGKVCMWDTRQKACLSSKALHVDATSGKQGAVGFILHSELDEHVIVTGGADGSVKVVDVREMKVVHDWHEHQDFIYSLHLYGNLCFSGAGDGMLHAHDMTTGKLLYGLGANQAAVRAIGTTPTQLIASGDDGGVLIYDM